MWKKTEDLMAQEYPSNMYTATKLILKRSSCFCVSVAFPLICVFLLLTDPHEKQYL